MYLCIYIATYLHTVYLDWPHVVIEKNSRCAWRWQSSELRDALRDRNRATLEMHLEAVIERVWRCIWRPRLSELRDALGGRDRARLEMHFEANIKWTQRCTPRAWWSEFGDAIRGWDWLNSEMHSEAVIERVKRYTWRPRLSELSVALGGRDRRDRVSLEMHFKAVIERVWRCNWRPGLSELRDALRGRDWGSLDIHFDLEAVDGRRARCWDSIHRLVNPKLWECHEVTLRLKLLLRTGWWRWIGREVHRKLKQHSGVTSKSWEWRDDRQS